MFGAPERIRTSDPRLSLPTTVFTAVLPVKTGTNICGLDHLFTVSGAARMASTEPHDNQQQT